MPIYEYYCNDCEKEFEVLQKISAQPLTECKFCSGNVEKMVSNSSFTFKGGGWYITDYKNKSKKNTKIANSTKVEKKEDNNKPSNRKKTTETKQANEPRKAS